MTVNGNTNSLQNLLVPAGGTVHSVSFIGTFSVDPQTIDWRQFSIDNFPFNPQGVFVDNTNGRVPLVIIITPLEWTISVAPGTTRAVNFPAPSGGGASITGDPENTVSVIFVDFPVFPDNGVVSETSTENSSFLPIFPGGASIAANGATSTNAPITTPTNGTLKLTNLGNTAMYAKWGTGVQTATIDPLNNLYIPAYGTLYVAANGADNIAAITAGGTGVLQVNPGMGVGTDADGQVNIRASDGGAIIMGANPISNALPVALAYDQAPSFTAFNNNGHGTEVMAVTNVSSNVTFEGGLPGQARFYNSGADICFINAYGPTASASSLPLGPGESIILSSQSSMVSAISAGGALNLYISPGVGR